jgi:hypothetical protein
MKSWISFGATLIVGALCGSAVTLGIVGHDLDLTYYQIRQLRLQHQELLRENLQLTDDIKKQADTRILKIRKLDIQIQSQDASVKLRLTRYVQDQLQFLIGRPLEQLASQPDMLQRLLNGRIVKLDDQSYTLRVDAIVLSETLHIWLHPES